VSALSPAQRAALEIPGDGLVLAGAGAGKTRTLVALCVRDLLGGVAPEELLVCTFTRAAAGEIKARLAGELAGIEQARRIDERAVRAGTIDAICADLVRERALELGLPPSFGLAPSHETAGIREDAYQVARTALGARLLALWPLINPADDEALRKALERVYDRAAARGLDPESVSAPDAGPGYPEAEELADALEDFAGGAAGAAEAVRADAAFLREGRVEGISDLFWRGLPYGQRARADELRAQVSDARTLTADPRAAPARAVLVEMCRHYAEWRRLRSAETGLLGFTDVALACRAGILSGAITRRFLHVYVDEAQDTNPLQLDILRRLRSGDGRMLGIGDVNQSIYAWRLADPRAFSRLGDEFPDTVTLDENHRTSADLLAAISAISAGLPELESGATTMVPKREPRPADPPLACLVLIEQGARPPSDLAEAAASVDAIEERRETLGLGHGDVAVLCRSTKAAGQWAEALRSRGIPALVLQRGGVMGSRESIFALDYLRLIADPDDEEALLSVLSGPLARMSGLERAAVFGAPEGRRWPVIHEHRPKLAEALRRHIGLRSALGVEELCRRALEEVGYLAAWEDADASGTASRNLAGLIRRIGTLAADGAGLGQVLGILGDSNSSEGEEDPEPAPPAPDLAAVRVMTIHGAKGEEFELVVLAGMSQPRGWFPQPAEVDAEGRVGVSVRGPNRVVGLLGDDVARRVNADNEALEAAEERRLIYVAMTRAKRGLVIVLSGRLDPHGTAHFQRAAQWLQPLVLPNDNPPLPGELRRDRLPSGVEIEIERLSPVDLRTDGPTEPEPRPDPNGSGLPAGLPLADGSLSYTALTDWRRCGLRRHLERELGLGDPQRPLMAPGGATRLGRRLHRALARIDWTRPLESEIARIGTLLGSLGAAERAHADRVLQGLASLTDLAAEIGAAGALRVEERFSLADRLPLTGRIDLRGEADDGTLIIDWKTGADPEERFTEDHTLQQEIYGLAALRAEPDLRRVRLGWAYLADEPARVEWRTLTRGDLGPIRERLDDEVARILALPAEAAASSEEPFCSGCPGLVRICSVSKASNDAESVDPEGSLLGEPRNDPPRRD